MSTTPDAEPPVPADSAAAAPPAKKKSDLGPRVVTAVVAVPVLLAMIVWLPHWVWAAFIFAACTAGLWEFNRMLQLEEPRSVTWASTAIGLVFYVVVYLFVGPGAVLDAGGHETLILFATLSATMWLAFLYNLMRPRDISRVATTMVAPLGALLYAGIGFTLVALMKRDLGAHGAGWILLTLAMIWMSDTGAYFAGRAFGKRKLAPKVSPNKTVEGAIGGLCGTLVGAFVFHFLMLDFLSIADVIVIAVVANFLGQTGDLCESLIKRSVGVKDSGTIIHGHGGMLDRVDAVLFAAPWVYVYGVLAAGRPLIG